ncbi:MAG: glycosyltransferase family 9 protein, partial [Rubrivivax sp.]|nr:glycosyltransferase family 9 protein [Rubrivivax sp.]
MNAPRRPEGANHGAQRDGASAISKQLPPAGVRRVAVFRALMLGDMLCALPALRALRHGFAQARLTLVGLPWAAQWAARLAEVDEFIAFPGHPALPETPAADVGELPFFLATVQARRFDLAVQLHGSGALSNVLVALLGARRSAGFAAADAWCPAADAALYRPWPEAGTEVERLLALTDHLGLPRCGEALAWPLRDEDRAALRLAWPGADAAAPFVVVHAGAQWPSRRWGVPRFAAVGEALAARGCTVVLTGVAAEAALVSDLERQLAARLPPPAAVVNLCGRTSLFALAALLERAALVVCNDTGVSHLAAALGRPSVVVSSGSDAARWAPADQRLHRTLAGAA